MRTRFTIESIKTSAVADLNRHLFEQPKVKKSKYGNRKTEYNGIQFDSQKECSRYKQLLLQQKAGHIAFLELQVRFDLTANGEKIGVYISDFTYILTETGEKVVEDVKSEMTRKLPVYRLKKKLMAACYNIEIKEV